MPHEINLQPLFSKDWYKVLREICFCLTPVRDANFYSDPAQMAARKQSMDQDLQRAIGRLPVTEVLRLRQFLKVFSNAWLSHLGLSPLIKGTAADKEKFLAGLANSDIPAFREGFQSVKRLAMLQFYGNLHHEGMQHFSSHIGFQHHALSASNPEPVRGCIEQPGAYYDVVIIGSGVGGSTMAALLATSGLKVLVIEKGGREQPQPPSEQGMINTHYEQSGSLSNLDHSILMLAGSTPGGGSVVNWQACLETPPEILDEWVRVSGISHFSSPEFREYFQRAGAMMGLVKPAQHSRQNSNLQHACRQLNYAWKEVENNLSITGNTTAEELQLNGLTGLGDPSGLKQSMLKTALRTAIDHHAELLCGATAQRVLHKQGAVYGVMVEINGQKEVIRCKTAVSSAGAIHTPALLRRSGLVHHDIGRHLYLHPAVPVTGLYDHKIKGWENPPMTSVCRQFQYMDDNYGYLIETPPLYPGFMALATPWRSAQSHLGYMNRAAYTGALIVLCRDRYPGRVEVNRKGLPVIHYRLNAYDRHHLIHGMAEAAGLHFAAGARQADVLHQQSAPFAPGEADPHEYVNRFSWAPNRFTAYSAHQMGTCRMAAGYNDGPLTPEGMTREVENLYVADASVFPVCSGVNPMLTISAMAHFIAEQVLARQSQVSMV